MEGDEKKVKPHGRKSNGNSHTVSAAPTDKVIVSDKLPTAKESIGDTVQTAKDNGAQSTNPTETSEMANNNSFTSPPKTPRAKTKGDIKKKLLKKKGEKNDTAEQRTSGESTSGSSKESAVVESPVNTPEPKTPQPNTPQTITPKPNTPPANTPERPVGETDGCNGVVGDLFWAKVGGHPWWPCMIALDPYDSIFYKVMGNRSKPSYHVQFFGNECHRGWIPDTRMTTYEGTEEHLKWLEKMKNEMGKSKRKDYEICKKQRRPAWDVACDEAAEAFQVDKRERVEKFGFSYSPLFKRKEIPSSPEENAEKAAKANGVKRKLEEDSDVKQSPPRKRKKDSKPQDNEETVKDGGVKKPPKSSKKKPENGDSDSGSGHARKTSTPINKRRLSSTSNEDRSSHKRDCLIEDTIKQVAAGAGKIPLKGFDDEKFKDSGNDTDDSCSMASSKGEAKISRVHKPKGVRLEDGEMFEPEICNLIANPTIKKEKICLKCEVPGGDLVQCDGPCLGAWHGACMGEETEVANPFKCEECATGLRSCFVCKNKAADLTKCTVAGCGRFYHLDCAKQFHLTGIENGRLTCASHTCATCAAEDHGNLKKQKGKLYRCIRCPTAYHVGDYCIAAGSLHLAGYSILCSRHFSPIKTQSHHTHVNVSWCFSCSQGGSLLCCETCPASFHIECLDIEHPPQEGAWYCPSCSAGKKPLYGDVVWLKIGNYRWWPGEVCHPRNVPNNIQEKCHQVGEFPVRFYGSRDYFWLHQARVFQYQEGDMGCKETGNAKSISKVFQKAQKEGAIAFKIWKEFQERRQETVERKPVPYRFVKTNQPVGTVTITKADPDECPRCECDHSLEEPCGEYSDCINRMTLEECHPAVCPAGKKCMNQRFQKRTYPESTPFRTPGRGWGLKTLANIKEGEFVNEYVGELIDDEEAKKRFKQAEVDNIDVFYMLTLDSKRVIDAGPKGNYSRFMNHSCAPNCGSQKWTVNGDVRVGLFALHDIPAGTELTFNYNLDALGNEKKKCACGASTCSGYLGVKAKKEEPEKTNKGLKKKKKKPQKKVADNECYRCGDVGEVMVCDRSTCTKVYHLKCLNLTTLPHGKWICPWHHCDICGKHAIKLCSECPNSFCPRHIENNIFSLPADNDRLVCSDHDDLIQQAAGKFGRLENEANSRVSALQQQSGSEATSTCDSDSEVSSVTMKSTITQEAASIVIGSEGDEKMILNGEVVCTAESSSKDVLSPGKKARQSKS